MKWQPAIRCRNGRMRRWRIERRHHSFVGFYEYDSAEIIIDGVRYPVINEAFEITDREGFTRMFGAINDGRVTYETTATFDLETLEAP